MARVWLLIWLLLPSLAHAGRFGAFFAAGVMRLDRPASTDPVEGFARSTSVGVRLRIFDPLVLALHVGHGGELVPFLQREVELLDIGLRAEVRLSQRWFVSLGGALVVVARAPKTQTMSRGVGVPLRVGWLVAREGVVDYRVGFELQPIVFDDSVLLSALLLVELVR
jgi:hypothetical protein